MVKLTSRKYTGEVKQKNTGEPLPPLVVSQSVERLWYSSLLPDVGFTDTWDACIIDRFMMDGRRPRRAMNTLKKGKAINKPV